MIKLASQILKALGSLLTAVLLLLGVANLLLVLAASFYFASQLLSGFGDAEGGQKVARIFGVLALMAVPTALGFVLFGTLRGTERHVLIRRYLRRKLAPIFALVAVTLCTAMVIIVISVMGGFLNLMADSAHRLTGDITIRSGLTGFAHYQELIDELEKQPQIEAATPMVRAYGLINLHQRVHTVEVLGVEPKSLSKVVDYRDSLYWSKDRIEQERADLAEMKADPYALKIYDSRKRVFSPFDLTELGMTMSPPDEWPWTKVPAGDHEKLKDTKDEPTKRPSFGMVIGIEVNPQNERTSKGSYLLTNSSSLATHVTLTVLPITDKGGVLDPAVEEVAIVNEFKSGLYEIDANRVYVPFALLQEMLNMDPGESYENFDPVTGEPIGEPTIIPARTTEIAIRGKADVPIEELTFVVQQVKSKLTQKHPELAGTYAMNWRQQYGALLGAVQNEKGLLTFLFSFISVVAIVMIGVIFYMIVLEKTRDIGTLRAIGASRGGIMSVFLGYGLTIGAIGSGLGLGLAAWIISNLNFIHKWLGNGLGAAVFVFGIAISAALLIGLPAGGFLGWKQDLRHGDMLRRVTRQGFRAAAIVAPIAFIIAWIILVMSPDLAESLNASISITIWDPRVYFFDEIPTNIDEVEVGVILIVAVCSSVIGALLPAYLAGLVDPVESLRYE